MELNRHFPNNTFWKWSMYEWKIFRRMNKVALYLSHRKHHSTWQQVSAPNSTQTSTEMDLINHFSLTVSASDQTQMFKCLGQEGNVGYQPIIMGSNYMFFRSGLATASFIEDGTIPFPRVRVWVEWITEWITSLTQINSLLLWEIIGYKWQVTCNHTIGQTQQFFSHHPTLISESVLKILIDYYFVITPILV